MHTNNPLHSNITVIPIKAFSDNYIWLIKDGNNAVLVDPGDAEPVLNYLSNNALCLKAILVTHKHHDHIGGIINIKERFPNINVYGPLNPSFNFKYTDVHEGDTIQIKGTNLHFNVLETPGHTNDHIVYYNEENLFCGDTLFGCGCGRLFEGTAEEMFNSLQKLKMLKPSTKVFCAHEYTMENIRFAKSIIKNNSLLSQRFHKDKLKLNTLPTTMEVELTTNPFLLAENSEEFKRIRLKKDVF
jgi:hydroxyacylglutathione hydrolase